MRRLHLCSLVACLLLLTGSCTTGGVGSSKPLTVTRRGSVTGPRVLCITAHPDDETVFAATLYKISSFLGGACDIVVLTNGEGGFKYSTLAERIYGSELTDEAIGRRDLPAIRRREMLAGCQLLEVRDLFFLDQRDHRYTQDAAEVLGPGAEVWDLGFLRQKLRRLLQERTYDFVFTMAPVPGTHGHHKAATILALEAVSHLDARERPVVLCASVSDEAAQEARLPGLDAYPITKVSADEGPWSFDRTQKFGFRNRLDYRVVVNLVIAAHRSQGTMQLAMNRGTLERFHLFVLNNEDAAERAKLLFKALAKKQFRSRVYGASAGTNAGGR